MRTLLCSTWYLAPSFVARLSHASEYHFTVCYRIVTFAAWGLQVRANSRALGARLMKHGYKLVTDGTDNHLVLWDLRKEVEPCCCTVLNCPHSMRH